MMSERKPNPALGRGSVCQVQRTAAFEELSAQIRGAMCARLSQINENVIVPMTQNKIADDMGVDAAQVSRLLKGSGNLTIRSIADYLGVTGSACLFHILPAERDDALRIGVTDSEVDKNGKGVLESSQSLEEHSIQIIKAACKKVLRGSKILSEISITPKTQNGLLCFEMIREQERSKSSGDEMVRVASSYITNDDHYKIEWKLIDMAGTERFRSRSLEQAAQVGAVLLTGE